MRELFIILLLACAWVCGRTMPKIAEGAYQLERQREAQMFMMELKGLGMPLPTPKQRKL